MNSRLLQYLFLFFTIFNISEKVYAVPQQLHKIKHNQDPHFQFVLDTESSANYKNKIISIAARSDCIKYKWKNRGQAPAGYIKGLSLSFARSLCRLYSKGSLLSPSLLMSKANTNNSSIDALSWYESTFDKLNLGIDENGPETLRSLYTLATGLGMRESSGSYCEGWDVSAGSSRSSSEAEAGLFQTSYDSIGFSPELKKLYDEYRANSNRCYLAEFQEGASCSPRSILGTGAGATYQKFTKNCPAFATEYAMALLRVQRKHFGPIIRKEAELIKSCDELYEDVESFVEQDRVKACQELI